MVHIHIIADHGVHCCRLPEKPEAHQTGDIRRETPIDREGRLNIYIVQ